MRHGGSRSPGGVSHLIKSETCSLNCGSRFYWACSQESKGLVTDSARRSVRIAHNSNFALYTCSNTYLVSEFYPPVHFLNFPSLQCPLYPETISILSLLSDLLYCPDCRTMVLSRDDNEPHLAGMLGTHHSWWHATPRQVARPQWRFTSHSRMLEIPPPLSFGRVGRLYNTTLLKNYTTIYDPILSSRH